jgi:hypothetical protein
VPPFTLSEPRVRASACDCFNRSATSAGRVSSSALSPRSAA